MTAAARNVRVIVATAAASGVAPARLLAEVGIDPQSLLADDARVASDVVLQLWQVAAARAGAPWLGLEVAARIQGDMLASLGLGMHACPTLGDSLRMFARYLGVMHQHARLDLVERGDEVAIAFEPRVEVEPERLRHPTECLLAVVIKVARRTTGVEIAPVAVELRHAGTPAPAYLDAFGVMPRFGQATSALVLPRAALALPNLGPDAALAKMAERQLQRRLDDLPTAETTSAAVQRLVREELQLGEPTLARLAARLHMSERTLQRRLAAETTTLQELLDHERRQASLRALAESRRTIAEIAFELGFAEVRAFHRAFKRWTGSTPAAYRQLRRAA